jgi:TolA-binding protein
VGLVCLTAAPVRADIGEVSLSKEELLKLDTFEGHTLAKADQTFHKKQYRQARAEYDAFILEFPRSKVVPYALLRKGRCAQFDDKRFQAIGDYDEILDFFPNDVKYAAAALYYIGDCHAANGDVVKAMKAWAQMADDKEYRQQPLAAFAINHLADHLLKQEKDAEAVKYYEQVAVTFRTSNRDASNHARGPVIRYYVRTAPNEPKFREFYANMKAFDHHPKTIPDDLTTDPTYWECLRGNIRGHGHFEDAQADERKRYYVYWSGQMRGKFPEDDEFQIEAANFGYLGNGDRAAWFRQLDSQYGRYAKPGDWARIKRWIEVYAEHPAKVEEYFRKVDATRIGTEGMVEVMLALWQAEGGRPLAKQLLDKLNFDQIENKRKGELALSFYEDDQIVTSRFLSKIDYAKMSGPEIGSFARSFWDRDTQLARHILQKVRYNEMTDRQIAGLARAFWHQSGEVVRDVCLRIGDKNYGKSELLSYYHWRHDSQNGLPLAEDLTKVDQYATAAWWAKAEFLDWSKQYAKAIDAYRNCQNEPTNLWRIAHCHDKLSKLDAAVAQTREIENFFPSEAPRAAMHIAQLYKRANEKKKYIGALRDVLKKYPDSGQSRQAHIELEQEGFKMGGGIDAQ